MAWSLYLDKDFTSTKYKPKKEKRKKKKKQYFYWSIALKKREKGKNKKICYYNLAIGKSTIITRKSFLFKEFKMKVNLLPN
jgi:hypothetical protein